MQCRNWIDLGASGCKFTWTNKQPLPGLIRKRLDRAVCNPLWRQTLQEATVLNLPRLHGDHCPLLLKFTGYTDHNQHMRPFRFEMAWLTHTTFPEFMENNWKQDAELSHNLKVFTVEVKKWNQNYFGNIFKSKRCLVSRINGVHRALERCPNPFLFNLEQQLLNEYNQTLLQEELIQFQEARSNWIQFGDRNTKCFHTTTIIRRRRNRVVALRRDDKSWCFDTDELKQMVLGHFQTVYTADMNVGHALICVLLLTFILMQTNLVF